MAKSKDKGLTLAITFAAIAISGSLVFFGIQLQATPASVSEVTDDQLRNAIEAFVKEQAPKEQIPDSGSASDVTAVSETDHIRGNNSAKISLIEYSDFECPFCKKFHPTPTQVIEAYDGQVNWIYRHFPLSFHDPLATKEAEASECANELGGNDKFWEYADLIFATTTSNGRGLDISDLPLLAEEIGLDEVAFRVCLDSGKYSDHITQDIAEGSKAGIRGTPGNIILNNETGEAVLVSGSQPFSVFESKIDRMLK